MADAILAYARERLRLDPVPLDRSATPEDLARLAGALIDRHGHDALDVLRLFADVLAPAVISCDSPRFLSFIPAAPTKASLLFDMVVSASSLQGISWLEASGAVHAENQALRFIADLAGLSDEAGGCFVAGGSAGNLSALAVARETAAAHREPPRDGWRVAVSEQTHSSVAKALMILGCKPLVVTDAEAGMTGPTLAATLDAHADARSVCAVVATAGTTNAGIVEDLAGISDVCRRRGLWFHVDGAYGAAALLAPSVRSLFDGIENADSLVVDPHKWLFAPFDCAALLYRDPELARSVHAQDASYLDVIHEHESEWNPSDYAYHLTRRARGLPLWFSLAVHGSDAYRDAIEAALATARAAAALVRAEPQLALVREPDLSIVLFRRHGWTDADYRRWSDDLLGAQIAFVTPTTWRGEPVARLAFLHPGTTIDIVEEILAATR